MTKQQKAGPSPFAPVLAIHGGAGALSRVLLSDKARNEYEEALRAVLRGGCRILEAGGTALDAVTEAVRLLEECPLFNAGRGAVFTSDGGHELDAAVMDGATLCSGAVAGVRTVRNPVLAARAVMERSQHVLFIGAGAEAYARGQGLEMVDPAFFSTAARREQLERVRRQGADRVMLDHDAQSAAARDPLSFRASAGSGAGGPPLDEDRKLGTVGAVALDARGNLAAATSTGGMTNKQPGRVGDSPLIGAGCYANNHTCAVSTTGTGEMFIRMVAAYDVSAQMEYAGAGLAAAAGSVIHDKLPRIGGQGGLIAVDAAGRVAMPFNTEGMYRGVMRAGQAPSVAIYEGGDA
ncbi:isoaspartyl peptidase/L-asparaginase [Candidimonas humi]|uniref:Isoaspartyl peptidase/L-asparaginase family protein n=1 Tax=Candidimonas humi TaxID=683355 RepID=A0ABV8NUN1_9BURK|nr:isoaspartyl peptidase/L-asparaginase [Candidimonas humi]MBV6303592.1 isoaspartyl peptidase/L-asparaginase [Candidimonas humi]